MGIANSTYAHEIHVQHLEKQHYQPADPDRVRDITISEMPWKHLRERLQILDRLRREMKRRYGALASNKKKQIQDTKEKLDDEFSFALRFWIDQTLRDLPSNWDELVIIGDENISMNQHIYAYFNALILAFSDRENLPQSLPSNESIMAGLLHDIGKPIAIARIMQGHSYLENPEALRDALQDCRHDGMTELSIIQEKSDLKKLLRAELKAGEKIETDAVLRVFGSSNGERKLKCECIELARALAMSHEDIDISTPPIEVAAINPDADMQELASQMLQLAKKAYPKLPDSRSEYSEDDERNLSDFFSYAVRHVCSDLSAYAYGIAGYEQGSPYGHFSPHRVPGLVKEFHWGEIFGNDGEFVPKIFEGIHGLGTQKFRDGIDKLRVQLGIREYNPDIVYLPLALHKTTAVQRKATTLLSNS